MTLSKRRGCEDWPEVISMRCARCLLVSESGPLPVDPNLLAVYPPPEGWKFVVTPVGQNDAWLCADCSKDVVGGSPIWL